MQSLHKYVPVLLFAVMMILAGCSASQSSSGNQNTSENQGESATNLEQNKERAIQHGMGETKILGTPERIVVLEIAYLDALASLGITPIGVADSEDSSTITEAVRKNIGEYTSVGAPEEPNLEVISSLKPDLIIADLSQHEAIYEELVNIAPTIVLGGSSEEYQGIIDDFSLIAQVVGKMNEAQKVLDEHFKQIEEMVAKIPPDESRVLMSIAVTEEESHIDSSIGSLLGSIGFNYAFGLESQGSHVSLDEVAELNPEVLFIVKGSGSQPIINEWKSNPLWQGIHAVQNGAVYEIDSAYWLGTKGLITSEVILEEVINYLYKK
jgi:ABC-type Fe3+-citrate transport system substrate-binding protein